MRLSPTGRRPLRVASPLPPSVLGPSLASGLSAPGLPRALPGRSGPFVVTGAVVPRGDGGTVSLRVQPASVLFPFTPSFEGALRPDGGGALVEGEVVEHRVARGYARALWLLPLLPLASVVLSLVLGGVEAALRSLLWALPALPLVLGVQHLWFAFVRRVYARQHAQLREYLATCCQAAPQEG